MNYIPGGRLIKKYIYRFIGGLLILPLSPSLLILNEWMAVGNVQPLFGNEIPGMFWIIRVAGSLLCIFSVYMMISGIRLFMNRIPLSYHEIRNGLRITSVLIGGCISSLSIAIAWLLHHPILGFIPLGLALTFFILWLIRLIPKMGNPKTTPSVKPHSTKDV